MDLDAEKGIFLSFSNSCFVSDSLGEHRGSCCLSSDVHLHLIMHFDAYWCLDDALSI